MTIGDFLAEHPAKRKSVDEHKERMLAEVRAYRLRELRDDAGLTQQQLAEQDRSLAASGFEDRAW
jgi:ribosome-binding protein aMBF1 (putative translation factor)